MDRGWELNVGPLVNEPIEEGLEEGQGVGLERSLEEGDLRRAFALERLVLWAEELEHRGGADLLENAGLLVEEVKALVLSEERPHCLNIISDDGADNVVDGGRVIERFLNLAEELRITGESSLSDDRVDLPARYKTPQARLDGRAATSSSNHPPGDGEIAREVLGAREEQRSKGAEHEAVSTLGRAEEEARQRRTPIHEEILLGRDQEIKGWGG